MSTKIVKCTKGQVIDGRTRREGEIVRVPASYTYQVEEVVSADELSARESAEVAEREKLDEQKDQDLTPPPVAVIEAPERGIVGQQIEFDGSTSVGRAEIALWSWDFGDRETAEGAVVQHAYTRAATYQVTLIVTDIYRHTDTAEHEIVIT